MQGYLEGDIPFAFGWMSFSLYFMHHLKWIVAVFSGLLMVFCAFGLFASYTAPYPSYKEKNSERIAIVGPYDLTRNTVSLITPCNEQHGNQESAICAQWNSTKYNEINIWITSFILISTLAFNCFFIIQSREQARFDKLPFASIEPVDGSKFRWDATNRVMGLETTAKGRQNITPAPLSLQVKSTGKSNAVLTGIHRQWSVTSGEEFPELVDPEVPQEGNNAYKSTYIPIGSGGILLAAPSERYIPNAKEEQHLFLTGYVEFCSADDDTQLYALGFAFTLRSDLKNRGLATAMPREKDGQYWYHRKLKRKRC